MANKNNKRVKRYRKNYLIKKCAKRMALVRSHRGNCQNIIDNVQNITSTSTNNADTRNKGKSSAEHGLKLQLPFDGSPHFTGESERSGWRFSVLQNTLKVEPQDVDNAYGMRQSVSCSTNDHFLDNQPKPSTSSGLQPMHIQLNESSFYENQKQPNLSNIDLKIEDPLSELHTSIDIKEEFGDGDKEEDDAEFQDDTENRMLDTSQPLESTDVKVEIPVETSVEETMAFSVEDKSEHAYIGKNNEQAIATNACQPESLSATKAIVEGHIYETATNINSVPLLVDNRRCPEEVLVIINNKEWSVNVDPNQSAPVFEPTDQLPLFGQYVVSQLNLLPLHASLLLQRDILNLIVKARLQHESGNNE